MMHVWRYVESFDAADRVPLQLSDHPSFSAVVLDFPVISDVAHKDHSHKEDI